MTGCIRVDEGVELAATFLGLTGPEWTRIIATGLVTAIVSTGIVLLTLWRTRKQDRSKILGAEARVAAKVVGDTLTDVLHDLVRSEEQLEDRSRFFNDLGSRAARMQWEAGTIRSGEVRKAVYTLAQRMVELSIAYSKDRVTIDGKPYIYEDRLAIALEYTLESVVPESNKLLRVLTRYCADQRDPFKEIGPVELPELPAFPVPRIKIALNPKSQSDSHEGDDD